MKLRELLAGVDVAEIAGDAEVEIAGLAYDSRRVEPGTLFFCVRGRALGRPRLRRPRRSSAAPRRWWSSGAWSCRVPQVRGRRRARGDGADRGRASGATRPRELRVAGITGTNGKTTTAFLIRHVLEAQGIQTGLLGTVKRIVGGVEEEVERTTPEAIDLQATFRRMLDGGDAACAMEVSSHALALEPHGRGPLRGRRVHQPDPGPPRLPRATWRTTSGPSALLVRRRSPGGRRS